MRLWWNYESLSSGILAMMSLQLRLWASEAVGPTPTPMQYIPFGAGLVIAAFARIVVAESIHYGIPQRSVSAYQFGLHR